MVKRELYLSEYHFTLEGEEELSVHYTYTNNLQSSVRSTTQEARMKSIFSLSLVVLIAFARSDAQLGVPTHKRLSSGDKNRIVRQFVKPQ